MGASISAVMSSALPTLLDVALKGAVLLALAGLATAALWRASAAMRHLVWSLTMAGLLALPVLSAFLPQWRVLPQWSHVAQPPSAVAVPQPPPTVTDAVLKPLVGQTQNHGESPVIPSLPVSAQPRAAVPHQTTRPWSDWLLPFWILGAALMLLPVIVGRLALWRLSRSARPVGSGSWSALLQTLTQQMRLRRSVILLETDLPVMPMAWGIRRARVLVPAESENWTPERRRAVLLHEIAHVRRRDCLTQLLTNLACAMHWFNPLAWVARRWMVAERERACDDLVLAAGFEPTDYAQHLLQIASTLRGGLLTSGAAIAMARPSKLEGRLLAVLDRKRSRRGLTRPLVLAGLVLTLGIAVPLACLRPQALPDTGGPISFSKADISQTVNVSVKKVHQAAINALKELDLKIDDNEFDLPEGFFQTFGNKSDAAFYAHLKAHYADGLRVWVDLRAEHGPENTYIVVGVGVESRADLAKQILEQILKNAMAEPQGKMRASSEPTPTASPATPGQTLASMTRIAVLDDADPIYEGKKNYEDTLTMYNAQGQQVWQYVGINTCETVGGNHEVLSTADRNIWIVELVGSRLLRFNESGELVWQKDNAHPCALAADPKTSNIWMLTGSDTIYGDKLLVLDPSGSKTLAEWKFGAFDIAYSRHDDCFWLVGKKVLKVSRDGNILYQSPGEFAWLAVSVGVNDKDGSVFVVERRHTQVAGSQDKLHILAPDGSERRAVNIEGGLPFAVAVDSMRGCAWLATNDRVLKVDVDGRIRLTAPVSSFSICIEPDTGYVWAAGRKGVYRLDQNGRVVWSKRSTRESQKWLCAIPPGINDSAAVPAVAAPASASPVPAKPVPDAESPFNRETIIGELPQKFGRSNLDQEFMRRLDDCHDDSIKALVAFYDAYALKPEEYLKLIPPPYLPGRKVFYEIGVPAVQVKAIPAGPETWVFSWSNGAISQQTMCFGKVTLESALRYSIGLRGRQYLVGDAVLLDKAFSGDFVFRKEASQEQRVLALQKTFQDAKRPLRVAFKDVETEVIVAQGTFVSKPLPEYENGTTVVFYGTAPREDSRSGGGGSGTFAESLDWLGDFLGQPVIAGNVVNAPHSVNFLDGPRFTGPDGSRLRKLPSEEADLVLRHVSEQTGLDFHRERRLVRMLIVEQELAPYKNPSMRTEEEAVPDIRPITTGSPAARPEAAAP